MSTKSLTKLLKDKVGEISFGGFLRGARTMRDMSQVEMADFLGMARGTLCDIEKGRQNVSIDLAWKIAKKCNLPEILAVEYAIQDQLKKSGLKLKVEVRKSS